MLVIGLAILIGVLVLTVALITDQEAVFTGVITILAMFIAFVWISFVIIDVPNEPKDLELVSSSEVEVIYTQGQYWIYNSNNEDFIPLFDKDLQSYVVYEKGLSLP